MSSSIHSHHYSVQAPSEQTARSRLVQARSEYTDSCNRLQELERLKAESLRNLFQVFHEAKSHLWIRLDEQLKNARPSFLAFYELDIRSHSLVTHALKNREDPLLVNRMCLFILDLLEACRKSPYFDGSMVIPQASQILDDMVKTQGEKLALNIESLVLRINVLVDDMCIEFRSESTGRQAELIQSAAHIEELFQDLRRENRPATIKELLSLGDMMRTFQRKYQDRSVITRIESLFVKFAEKQSSLEEAQIKHLKFRAEFFQAQLAYRKSCIHKQPEESGIWQGGSPNFSFGASGLCPRQRSE